YAEWTSTVAVRPRIVHAVSLAPPAAATRAASAHGPSSVITAPEAASEAARAAASAAPAVRCAVTAAPPTAARPTESVAVTVRMPAASAVPAMGSAPFAFEAHRPPDRAQLCACRGTLINRPTRKSADAVTHTRSPA